MSKTFVGTRLRQLRSERGMSQIALASALEISSAYLNQIEHDRRPLTVPVLLKICEVFGVDASFFDSNDNTRLVAELREVLLDEDVAYESATTEVADLVNSHPNIARAMVGLHQRFRSVTEQLTAATNGRSGDGTNRGSITAPHEEVRNFFYQRQNYIHELDTAAEDLTKRMRMHSSNIRSEIRERLLHHGVQLAPRVDLGDNLLHTFDPTTKRFEFSAHLSAGQTAFKFASELAYLECGELLNQLVSDADFTSTEARKLALLGLANYYAAAVILPYSQFHGAAQEFRYDIERLSAFYSVSYETICHRLSTLQRPNLRGIPFSFVRVDRAGNMSKRQSATGFHFTSNGGTCPLWNVYETFTNPGRIQVQIAQMPDGRNYLWVARTVERRAAHYGQPGKSFALGIGCELRHAGRLVYGDGLDIGPTAHVTLIGSGCRVCEREKCPQRAFPALGAHLTIDEHRSTVSPY